MMYILSSIFVSHVVALITLTALTIDNNKLLYTLSLTFQILLLTLHFVHKIRPIKHSLGIQLFHTFIRISVLALGLSIDGKEFKYFFIGSYMQYLLKQEPIISRILGPLGCLFYFIMWGTTNDTIITGILFNLLILLNSCVKYYAKHTQVTQQQPQQAEQHNLISPHPSPNHSANHINVRDVVYHSQPSIDPQLSNVKGEQFKRVFNSFPDGIVTVNMHKQVLFINRNFKRMMGSVSMKDSFQRLLKLRNVHSQITELENASKLLEDKKWIQQASVEPEQQSYFQKSFEESRYDDQASYKSTFAQSSHSFETVKHFLDHLIANAVDKSCITKMICQQNENQLFQVSFKPFNKGSNQFILLIVSDITSFNQITHLKKANADKSQLLSTVAHEFRTPLSCMKMLLEQLQPSSSEETMQKFIRPIMSQIDCFIYMVQDLLDASVMNAGKFKLNIQSVNLHALIMEVYKIMVVQAQGKQNDLLINLRGLPEIIHSDPYKIRQVLINLIGNSLKFTSKGQIQVSGRALTGRTIEITVTDDGLGINAQNQQHLFKAFGKLDDPTNINPQGIGLGLVLSNALVKKLSHPTDGIGLIAVSEGEGMGSKFSFQLFDFEEMKVNSYQQESLIRQQRTCFLPPINMVKQFDSFRMSEIDVSNSGHPCTCPDIMLVDDQYVILQGLKRQLEQRGLKVVQSFTGFDCIKRVEQIMSNNCNCKTFKVIILDVDMPGISGIETCKRLIKMGFTGAILGHSGYQGEQERDECFAAGMVAYFLKPLDIDQLMIWLEQNKVIH